MRRVLSAATAAVLAIGVLAGPTLAGAPENPGCFGQDRAAAIQDVFLGTGDPGASEVGAIVADRAAENGTINRAHKEFCGGTPGE